MNSAVKPPPRPTISLKNTYTLFPTQVKTFPINLYRLDSVLRWSFESFPVKSSSESIILAAGRAFDDSVAAAAHL